MKIFMGHISIGQEEIDGLAGSEKKSINMKF